MFLYSKQQFNLSISLSFNDHCKCTRFIGGSTPYFFITTKLSQIAVLSANTDRPLTKWTFFGNKPFLLSQFQNNRYYKFLEDKILRKTKKGSISTALTCTYNKLYTYHVCILALNLCNDTSLSQPLAEIFNKALRSIPR